MKDKKKIGIISAIIVAILAIILLIVHINNNGTGTYENAASASLIDLEPKGKGYFYEECVFAHNNVPLNWTKLKGNNYQIQFNLNGQQVSFNATIKGNKLNTEAGVNWKKTNFQKQKQSFNDLKQKLYNQYNIQAKTIYNSNETHYWITYCNDPGLEIQDITVTKDGKYKDYDFLATRYDAISLKGQDPQKLINFYEKHEKKPKWKKINSDHLFTGLSNKTRGFYLKTYGYTGAQSSNNDFNTVLVMPNKAGKIMPTIHF